MHYEEGQKSNKKAEEETQSEKPSHGGIRRGANKKKIKTNYQIKRAKKIKEKASSTEEERLITDEEHHNDTATHQMEDKNTKESRSKESEENPVVVEGRLKPLEVKKVDKNGKNMLYIYIYIYIYIYYFTLSFALFIE